MTHRKHALLAGVIALLVFVLLASFKVMQIRAAIAFGQSFPEAYETVESAYVSKQPFQETVTVYAEVLAPQALLVTSKESGHITHVGFKSGQTVRKGQLLIQQDVAEEQAQLAGAKAQLALATETFNRAQGVLVEQGISQQAFDEAKANVLVYRSQVNRLQAIIDRKTITAPFTGRVGLHTWLVGHFLPAETVVVPLVKHTDEYWLDFTLPPFYSPIAIGTAIRFELLNPSHIETNPTDYHATVIAQSPMLDEHSRVLQYRAQTPRQPSMVVGSMLRAHIPIGDAREYLAIPSTAVQHDNLGAYVFILQVDSKKSGYRAKRASVNVKATREGMAYIEGDLNVGQLVATDGAFKLHPGLWVKTQAPSLSHAPDLHPETAIDE